MSDTPGVIPVPDPGTPMPTDEPEVLDGLVSLGIGTREGVVCPVCENESGLITHDGQGREVLCCTACHGFWRPDAA